METQYSKLSEIAFKYDTDKQNVHNYFTLIYDEILSPLKFECKNFMEIGIYDGGSIKLWRDYFINANIIALEYNLPYSLQFFSGDSKERIEFVNADQSKEEDLLNVANRFRNIDVILDDGSHIQKDQQISFGILFESVKPGGIYIIEDLHTSFVAKKRNKYEHYFGDADHTTLDFLIDYKKNKKFTSIYLNENQINYLNEWVDSVEIYNSSPEWSYTSIIRKKL
jgi:hypothetical protein